jgi:IS5 family transposase
MIDQRFHNHPKRRRKAMAANRRLKTIAGRLVRDIKRHMMSNYGSITVFLDRGETAITRSIAFMLRR